MLCVVFFLSFFITCFDAKNAGPPAGGENIEIEAVPYHVSIEYNGVHFCSGVIIDTEFILTAAHCLFGAQGLVEVRAGSALRMEGGTVHKVVSRRYPDDYNFAQRKKDVALYRVNPPFDLESGYTDLVQMAEPYQVLEAGSLGVATGFGFLQLAGSKTPVHLRFAMYPMTSDEICHRYFKDSHYIFCVKVPAGGVDNCLFDHGAPLVFDGVVFGIAVGTHCGKAYVPNAYSKVSAVRPWIDDTIAHMKENHSLQ